MKILKRVLALLLALVVLAVGAAAVFFFVMHPRSRPAPDVKAPATAEAIARGEYLSAHVAGCTVCHSPIDPTQPGDFPLEGKLGAGRDFVELVGFPGHVRAPNISPDPRHGIGGWTDGEVLRAMREGVGRSGRALFPMMPYGPYARRLGDDDALAIIAYLRSLPPQANDAGVTDVNFPISMFIRMAPKPVETPAPPAPGAGDPVARGEWLIEVASCAECHSQSENGKAVAGLRMAGNTRAFELPGGVAVYAPNLTSDAATGIGQYADADLLRALTDGVGRNGKPLYIMPWGAYRGMTDDDRKAVVAALRKLPPVSHAVPSLMKR